MRTYYQSFRKPSVSWTGDRSLFLSVESSRCERRYKDGLLLIGDSARVISPVGGVRITYAVQDVAAAANAFAKPLKEGSLRRRLEAVQQRRELPTRLIQAGQALLQRRLGPSVVAEEPLAPPTVVRVLLRLPILRALPVRIIGFGP